MPDALRDFIYVDDVVDGLVKAAGLRATGFQVFNIGSGQGPV
jgi:nucleoside-diphosphate-sugar epimerase